MSLGPYGASGQVPIFILPDGTSMCQSRAILKYLGHVVSYGGSPRAARAATGRVVGAAALSSPRRRRRRTVVGAAALSSPRRRAAAV